MSKSIGQNRILQQMKAMAKERPQCLFAQPLENDLFIWHFTILGPQNTDFHQGIYHGQIVLPFEYPFKPPDIYFFTKNGRFEAQTKICLTITQYHPEEWNAAWTIRTMLQAVISLFNQHVPGVGYVEASSDVRQHLAKESQSFVCEKCGALKNILKIRKPMQIVTPTVLPKPYQFASHDNRKTSEAMVFSQDNPQLHERYNPQKEIPQTIPEVVPTQSIDFPKMHEKQTTLPLKPKLSIFQAVKKNIGLLQMAQITTKFTKRHE